MGGLHMAFDTNEKFVKGLTDLRGGLPHELRLSNMMYYLHSTLMALNM